MTVRITSKKQKPEKMDIQNLKTEEYEWEDNTLDKIKQEFEDKSILFIEMIVNNNYLSIEFGSECCFIEMTDEEKAEIYIYKNVKEEDADEYIDLYANCYKKSCLCYNFNDMIEIIQAFSLTGEPDLNYQWEIIPM